MLCSVAFDVIIFPKSQKFWTPSPTLILGKCFALNISLSSFTERSVLHLIHVIAVLLGLHPFMCS